MHLFEDVENIFWDLATFKKEGFLAIFKKMPNNWTTYLTNQSTKNSVRCQFILLFCLIRSKQYRVNSLNSQLLNRQEGLPSLNVLFFFLSKRPQINRFQTLTRGNNEPICIHMMTRIFRDKLLMNVSSTHSNRNNILGAFTYTFGLLRSLCIKSFYVCIRITIENDLLYLEFLCNQSL